MTRAFAWLLLALALGGTAASVDADETSLRELVQEYRSHLQRRDDVAYKEQQRVLGMIAARRTDEARKTLTTLLAEHGSADRRAAAVLLGALVRYGSPRDLDAAIDWVEARRDPLMVDLLHLVVAEARLPHTRKHLRGAALSSATSRVKVQIVRALGDSGESAAVPPLLALVREPNLLVRIETLEALGRLRSRRALPVIQVFLRDQDVHVRDAAARGLGHLGSAQAVPALVRALQDPAWRVAESAAAALARIDDPRAIPPLIESLARMRGKDLRLEDAFVDALQKLSGKAIQNDVDLWRTWWAQASKRKPFVKGREKPGTDSVAGPRYYGFSVRSSRVVFVLDVSRSMGWHGRLVKAKAELIKVLKDLPPTTRFKVLVYSKGVRQWPSKRRGELFRATKDRKGGAVSFVDKLEPEGGTPTYDALEAAFDHHDADTIYFLSDGNPSTGRVTDPEQILARVRDWNRFRRVRIHSFFMLRGQPPLWARSLENPERAFAFMKRLASENNGRFKKVD